MKRAFCLIAIFLMGVVIGPMAQAAPEKIRVVTDENFPPYIFINSDQQPEGYLVDLWRLWEEKTGIQVELIATAWSEAQAMMRRGEADVIESIYRTPEREVLYEFSKPYAAQGSFIYAHESISGIGGPGALKGFLVGVEDGDACIEMLAQKGITTLQKFRGYPSMIQAAIDQEIKLFCLDEAPADFYLYRMGVQDRFKQAFELYRGELHRAVRKGDAALLTTIENGMAGIPESEKDALKKKWMGHPLSLAPYAAVAGPVLIALLLLGSLLALWVLVLRSQVRKRTAALEFSTAQLATLVRTIPDLVWLKNPEGVYLACNPVFERLFGAPEKDIVGKTDYDFVDPQTADFFRENDRKAMSTGLASFNEEWLTFAGNTEKRLFETVKTPMYTSEGMLIGVLGIARDITRRRQVENELRASEEKLRLAQRSAGLGSWESDLRTGVTYWSPEVEAMYGLLPGEFKGDQESWLARVHPDDRERLMQQMAYYLERPEPFEIEFRILRDDAETRWMVSRGQVYFDDDGVARRIVGVNFDITEKKRIAEELRRYREELEALVAQRTLQLADARDAAEAANRAKSAFLANMSHEIRTPMNAIIGMAFLLSRRLEDPDALNKLGKITASGRHLLGIINDLLDFSKIEAGKLQLEQQPVDLPGIISTMLLPCSPIRLLPRGLD